VGVRADVQMTLGFGEVTAAIEAGIVRGMNKASEQMLADAVDKAPMQTGALRGSGQAVHAGNIEEPASVVFDTPYATRLHEHPEYNFSTDVNPNAQGKFLEEPALDNRATYGDIIRTEARRA
jgi:hypothetical protein